ncbi:MAG: HAD family hydrolase [Candidatus Micrarchaeaceae archaeon]
MRISDKYDLFIFDWDGTLERVMYMYKLNERLNPFWKNKKKSSFKDAASPNDKRQIEKQLKRLENIEERDERKLKFLLDMYMLFEKPKMQDGSLSVLRSLYNRGKAMAIFSNGASWRIKREIRDLSIDHYFSALISAQHIGSLKPNPLGIHLIMRKCGAVSRRTLYIGDMVDDIKTARAAGVDSCGIAAGFDNYTALEDEKPTYLFRNMREFQKAL